MKGVKSTTHSDTPLPEHPPTLFPISPNKVEENLACTKKKKHNKENQKTKQNNCTNCSKAAEGRRNRNYRIKGREIDTGRMIGRTAAWAWNRMGRWEGKRRWKGKRRKWKGKRRWNWRRIRQWNGKRGIRGGRRRWRWRWLMTTQWLCQAPPLGPW